MKNASPYVIVDNVEESVEYYQGIMGGEIKILNKQEGRVMHAELHLGGGHVHFSDSYGRTPKGENIRIILQCESEEEIRKVFDGLKADGQVAVELQDTFFGALHGQVTDGKNQITWVLNFFKRS